MLGSPLFIVSGPELVIAQCKAGIIGSFPALNARPVEKLGEWLTRIEDELGEYKAQQPGREGRALRGQPDLPRLQRPADEGHGDLREAQGADHHHLAAPAAGDRRGRALLRRRGVSRRHQRQARAKAAEQGVDGLILVCAGAGGHAGTLSPFALVREVKQWFKGTILLSGAISDGWSIASALALGADLAYMGTRFIATEKPMPTSAYKQALIEHAATTSSIPICSPACTATISAHRSRPPGSIRNNLPVADKSKMNFGSGGNMKVKGLARHLGLGSGHRPDRRCAAGCRTGRAAEGRIR